MVQVFALGQPVKKLYLGKEQGWLQVKHSAVAQDAVHPVIMQDQHTVKGTNAE